ncbi:MAG: transcription-repair coupling factor [Clostridiales bacterium]|nr:transcription-repair coupling factor [Clostridiales bacterium]
MKKNFFTLKNLNGSYSQIYVDIRLGMPTAVFGVSQQHKYFTASVCDSPILYITADALSAQKARDAIEVLSGKKTVLISAKDEVLLYKDAISKDALFRRINAVYGLLNGAENIVCDIEAALQLFPSKIECVTLNIGDEYDYASLPARLIQMGYTREYSVEAKGSFAVRGDILDIFPINEENPVRIDFFGDTVERIRPYDSVSGERLEEKQGVNLVAATEVYIENDDLDYVKKVFSVLIKKFDNAKAYERASAIRDDIFAKMELGTTFTGASYLLPLLKSTKTLFHLLPKNTVIIFDECKLINDRMEWVIKEYQERFLELKKGGEVFAFCAEQIIKKQAFINLIRPFKTCALQTFTSSTQFFSPLKTYNLRSSPAPGYLNAVSGLITDCKNWLSNGYSVLVFAGSVQRSEKLSNMLLDEYLPVYSMPDIMQALHGVTVCSEELEHGIILHENKLVIIGSNDLYTKSAVSKRIKRRRNDMFAAPEIGDFAVHEKHGIGKITGTKKIETTDGIKEYVSIEYKGGDMLYVPVEQMDVLSKYVGDGNPTLSKIGGADFERVKERVKQSIKKLAFDLKQLYKQRGEKRGFNFPKNEVMMQEFEDAFVHEETADQISSIEEIKTDMCSDKVMDRLLCGDVGYGKTEVALRAAYLCVLGCKQAAIMCPSTILSEQHYNTAIERFKEFGVRVEKLNRFKTPKQQEQTLKRLANGEIDLIIGTHRLLSKDVKFYDLGLLILDEEQRFGVEHKEKIKHIKNDVDCLTMSATPIPRTLHMSLAGIRDISTINTPPQKRLPVQTYVVEETETLIRDACIREISRGGQVFILYNRVESISSFAGKISEIVPEAKVCYAHGRMDRETLESSVFSFYRGEKNILVTTTIIENGIDLPNANTIIVIDSDRLGISQLYQLRGRVGRGSRLASAYFTFKAEKVMTSDAAERLKAIMQFTELGSGFKIAMRDLEIRGAGNVLGAEQHGHMDKVGYELYSKLLKEELTGESQFTAELDIKASAYIPESYVESSAGRMDCYKQIAEIRSVEDYKRVCLSIEDNYGSMPDEVLNLLIIAVLKSYAAKFNIKKIGVNNGGGYLELPSINSLKDERIATALDKYSDKISLSMMQAPLITFKTRSNPTKTMLDMTKFLKFAISFV